jgi:hypothetical protein
MAVFQDAWLMRNGRAELTQAKSEQGCERQGLLFWRRNELDFNRQIVPSSKHAKARTPTRYLRKTKDLAKAEGKKEREKLSRSFCPGGGRQNSGRNSLMTND